MKIVYLFLCILFLVIHVGESTYAGDDCPTAIETEDQIRIETLGSVIDNFVPTCQNRYQEACDIFKQAPSVLSTFPDGSLRVNPLSLTDDIRRENPGLMEVSNINYQNVKSNIAPLFYEMKQAVIGKLQEMPESSFRQRMIQDISKIGLIVLDRERCNRPNRPAVVASYDHGNNQVTICPLMSHMDAYSLMSILTHELGHALDLCEIGIKGETPESYPFNDYHQCMNSSENACPRNYDREENEKFADYVSARISKWLFERNPFRTNMQGADRFGSYVGYRMLGCEEGTPPLSIAESMRQLGENLGCRATTALANDDEVVKQCLDLFENE